MVGGLLSGWLKTCGLHSDKTGSMTARRARAMARAVQTEMRFAGIEVLEPRMLLSAGIISSANESNYTILDDGKVGSQAISSITVSSAPANAVVTGVDVRYKISHTYVGDLKVWATTQQGASWNDYTLWNRTASSVANLDKSVTGISTWNGLSPNRTWYLSADDQVKLDAGYIDSFSIVIRWSAPDAPTPTSPSAGDSYENDNSATVAKAISSGQTQSRSIHVVGDVDWAKFTLGQRSNVSIETNGTSGDTQLYLYGANNTTNSIAYDDDTGNGAFSLINRTGTSALDPGTYYIKVQGYNNNTRITAYTLSMTATPSATVPTAPLGLTATAVSTSQINLTWSDVSTETGYRIERRTETGAWTTTTNPALGANVTSYQDKGLVAGSVYYYRVLAYNTVGNALNYSPEANARTIAAVLPPTNVVATDRTYTDKVQVTWSAAVNTAKYEVWRNTSNNSGTASKISGTDVVGLSYADTTAVAGTTYYYWVKAKNAAGVVSSYSASDAGTRAVVTLLAPTNVVASDRTYTDKVRITWDRVNNATAYEVWRSSGDSSAPLAKINTANITTQYYDDFTAVAGVTYFYYIKAKNPAVLDSTSSVAAKGTRSLPARRYISGTISGAGIGLNSTINVQISRVGDGSNAIDPTLPTWIIIHGRDASSDSGYIQDLAKNIGDYANNDQVLLVDWRMGATDNRASISLEGSRWISKVAVWVDDQLRKLGIAPNSLRLVGHSWGALMANDIARLQNRNVGNTVGSKVQAIVALDPAVAEAAKGTSILGSMYNDAGLDFKANAINSWAFNSSAYGSNKYANTATESFDAEIGDPLSVNAHTAIVSLFTDMVAKSNRTGTSYINNSVINLFGLNRLLNGGTVPWAKIDTSFEATIQATKLNGKWQLLSIKYGSNGSDAVTRDIAGNTLASAKVIAVGDQVRNWVGTVNTLDYYRLTLTSAQTIRININPLDGPVEAMLSLLDSSGQPIRVINVSGVYTPSWLGLLGDIVNTSSPISYKLSAGTYYLKVTPNGSYGTHFNTYYDLSVNRV